MIIFNVDSVEYDEKQKRYEVVSFGRTIYVNDENVLTITKIGYEDKGVHVSVD